MRNVILNAFESYSNQNTESNTEIENVFLINDPINKIYLYISSDSHYVSFKSSNDMKLVLI